MALTEGSESSFSEQPDVGAVIKAWRDSLQNVRDGTAGVTIMAGEEVIQVSPENADELEAEMYEAYGAQYPDAFSDYQGALE